MRVVCDWVIWESGTVHACGSSLRALYVRPSLGARVQTDELGKSIIGWTSLLVCAPGAFAMHRIAEDPRDPRQDTWGQLFSCMGQG